MYLTWSNDLASLNVLNAQAHKNFPGKDEKVLGTKPMQNFR